MSDEDLNDKNGEGSDPSSTPILVALGAVFLLGVALGGFYYMMLRSLRNRPSVIHVTMAAVTLVTFAVAMLMHPMASFTEGISDPTKLGDNWMKLMPLYTMINVVIGDILGWVLVRNAVNTMEDSPHLLTTKGTWMYGFKYRRTPKEKKQHKQIIERLKNGSYGDEKRSPLGVDETEDRPYMPAFRYATEARRHTWIIGGSGSGKSITMLSLIKNDIEVGVPVFSIDMKGSPTFAAKLAAWAKENDREFYHFVHGKPGDYRIPNSPGQASYDPLGSGTASSKADMLLNLRAWDDAASVYKEDMKQLLSVLFNALEQADPSKAPKIDWAHGGIYTVYSTLQGNNLEHLAVACEGKPVQMAIELIAKEYEDAKLKGRTNQGVPNAINNLRGQMNTIINSDFGRWMKTEPKGRNINFAKVAKKRNAVVLFSLDSDNSEEFSKYVGSMIMADIARLSSSLRDEQEKKQIAIYADEFQTLNMETVRGLLEKGRESGMAITLAQQALEQVIVASPSNGAAILDSIMNVCSNFIVHAGSTYDSAERLAKLIGKEKYIDYATTNNAERRSLFGKKSKKQPNVTLHGTEKERWKFSPEQFMSLSIPDETNGNRATAVLVNKKSADPYFSDVRGGLARELWMIPSQDVLTDYYAAGVSTPPKDQEKPQRRSGGIDLAKEEGAEIHAPKPLDDTPIKRKPVKKASIAQGVEREKTLPKVAPRVAEDTSIDDGYTPYPDEYYEDSYPVDDDGDFEWDDVDEESTPEEDTPSMDFSQLSNLSTSLKDEDEEESHVPNYYEGSRSEMKESKFERQQREHKEKKQREREAATQAKAAKSAAKPAPKNASKPPQGASKATEGSGIPLPPLGASVVVSGGATAASAVNSDDDMDDIALPSLDDLFG